MTRPGTRPALEAADVFRSVESLVFGESPRLRLSPSQYKAFRAIVRCRTRELGGHTRLCGDCGRRDSSYNSCRNRHCPKCQAGRRFQWTTDRERELLPVPYFHVVFTLPHGLAPLALQNRKLIYGLLMRSAAATLRTVAADPRRLGAEIGGVTVLHTWGQNLTHHPHVHCVIPGGGLSAEGNGWIACRRSFFLPVRVLSRVFRGKFIAGLKRTFRAGELEFHGELAALAEPNRFEHLLNVVARRDWVVYAKRPFGGPSQVLKYLARYTHRVAIANSRLLELKEGRVAFRWKNYAAGHARQTMTLDAIEFVRRFLLHTLPSGFHRIRHFGLLGNRVRLRNLTRCRELLADSPATVEPTAAGPADSPAPSAPIETETPTCAVCGSERVMVFHLPSLIVRGRSGCSKSRRRASFDSS